MNTDDLIIFNVSHAIATALVNDDFSGLNEDDEKAIDLFFEYNKGYGLTMVVINTEQNSGVCDVTNFYTDNLIQVTLQ